MSDSAAPSAAFGAFETSTALSGDAIEAKARELLGQLTLDEKLGMMDGDTAFWPGLADMFGGGYNRHLWVAGAVPRLGIPGIRFCDGPRGIVMAGATTFPVSMARGAAWDPDLEERIGNAIGRELRALGGNFFGGVCVNLLRHPAWGRAQETYGEDPHHVGVLGAALTRGVQRHVMACVKHFALNSIENARFTVDVTADARTLHEIYLPHFKRAVDAGVAAVMSAYNRVNGAWCGENAPLLTNVLKAQWGFRGFVVSDFIWGARDAAKAARAGLDVEMPFQNLYHRHLADLVARGEVPAARVDDAALRLLRQQIRFGQGRDARGYGPEVVGCAAHRALAREAAQKSLVLLKNDGDVLPLRDPRCVAVLGVLAATPTTGDTGSSNTSPAYVVTPLDGLRGALADTATVVHDDGRDIERAATTAAAADVAICVVGYTHRDEGEYVGPEVMFDFASCLPPPTAEERPFLDALAARAAERPPGDVGGDRDALTLHADDEALIRAVAAANPRTVVVIMGGSAVITDAWRGHVPAILVVWYPGMEAGHALADALLGRINPSAKLPCSFPRRPEDLPCFDKHARAITYDLWHGYRMLDRDGAEPAFPFGFGLAYTTYRYESLTLDDGELRPDATLGATVTVTNTGAVAGEEIVQLYVSAPDSAVERAPRELKAFARVALAPGETSAVRLEVPVAELAYYDARRGWTVEPITYEVMVGRHSRDPQALHARIRIV